MIHHKTQGQVFWISCFSFTKFSSEVTDFFITKARSALLFFLALWAAARAKTCGSLSAKLATLCLLVLSEASSQLFLGLPTTETEGGLILSIFISVSNQSFSYSMSLWNFLLCFVNFSLNLLTNVWKVTFSELLFILSSPPFSLIKT